MHCQSVGTHPRTLVDLSRLFLVHESTLYHPPADGTLKRPKTKETEQDVPKVWLDVASSHEIGEGSSKEDSNGATNHSVEPLPEEDVLEATHVHSFVLVHQKPLRALLVLFKLGFPLGFSDGRQDPMRFPAHHGETTLCQACIPADPNNGEDGGAD